VIKIAQCDLWFPPIELPVGFGQVRKPAQLPVLTMVLGYSRWLLAMLVPSRRAEDLFAGWWRLIERLARCRGCWWGRRRRRSAAGVMAPAS
jgi:hypothetical protein